MALFRAARFLPLAVLAAVAVQCSLLDSPDGSGSLSLAIEMPVSLTIVPNFDMTPASFVVAGSGPGGRTFSATTNSTSITRTGLRAGTWSVSVNARNASGAVIAQGSGSVSVSGNQTASLAVKVMPLPGNGSLSVTVTWNSANVPSPSLVGQLLPVSGAAIPLVFTTGAGTATGTATAAAGYYTLTVQLLSGGALIMGAVDVARIVQGQLTTGTYDFTSASASSGSAGGALVVSLSTANTAPLGVTLSGQASTLSVGASMTITAGVSGYAGNVTYVWYLNGQSIATGSTASPSLTVGGNLPADSYRLDVAAFSADGMRAGSASCAFTIQ